VLNSHFTCFHFEENNLIFSFPEVLMFRKRRSLSFYFLIILSMVFFASQAAAAQSDDRAADQAADLQKDLSAELAKYTLARVDSAAAREQADRTKRLRLRAADRDYDLELAPNDMRSPRYRAEETGPNGVREVAFGGVNTFKGKVAGDSGSNVRLFIDGNKIEGYFFTGRDKFMVEPASHFSKAAQPDDLVIYRLEDMLHPVSLNCKTHVHQKIAAGAELAAAQMVPEVVGLRVIEIATDADFEYTSATGASAATNADILNTMNMVEGVYENELGITFQVVFQHTWATADPYIATNTDGLVRAFQGYWNANYPTTQIPRDTAHLWTAKGYASSQGYAFIDVICDHPESAYGMSGKLDWVPAKYEITAHEIGHNLGAVHVEAAQNCANTLMNAQLTTSTPFTFCAESRTEIANHVAAAGGCMSTRSSAPTRFDFDGDGKADLSLFRPSNGVWFILNSGNASFSIFQFGQIGDKPVAADYDGDGRADAAVYRNGGWFRLKSSNGTVDGIGFGLPSDIAAPADFDGDGKTDVAVFRPSEGRWYIFPTTAPAFNVVTFGLSGDIPVPADYDGDGKADVNLFRPSSGIWYRLNSSNGAFAALQFGSPGDQPQLGDFDGDGKADQVVYRPSSGSWYVFFSTTNNFGGIGFGMAGDIPIPADFDGDGKTDFAVFRPANANWYRLQSQDNGFYVYQFGNSADIPAPAR
jgi:hypothetical protein